jgi:hypothetical protein
MVDIYSKSIFVTKSAGHKVFEKPQAREKVGKLLCLNLTV